MKLAVICTQCKYRSCLITIKPPLPLHPLLFTMINCNKICVNFRETCMLMFVKGIASEKKINFICSDF